MTAQAKQLESFTPKSEDGDASEVAIPLVVPIPEQLYGKLAVIKGDYLAAVAALNTALARLTDVADFALILAGVPAAYHGMYGIDPEQIERGVQVQEDRLPKPQGEVVEQASSSPQS